MRQRRSDKPGAMRKRLIFFIGVVLGVFLAGSIRAQILPPPETASVVTCTNAGN